MKIIHTSDWHLGQSFFNKSRRREHQAFLNWLLDIVEQQQIDAVVVAGDVFDTGTPPSYAREIYNQFVVDMQSRQCTLVVLGGNHDAVSTLNESKQVLACLNTYVVASTNMPLEQQVIPLKKRNGDMGALLCAIPFIRPRDVMQSQAGQTGLDKRHSLAQAIKKHYQDIYQHALHLKQENAWSIPIIGSGHLTAMGVTQSDSVRDIYIGTLDGFDASGFPPCDYIALGHIHRPQRVAKSEHIRYSGSPIPLSFDEIGTAKQINIVSFSEDKLSGIEPLDIPVFQQMAVIRGSLNHIESELNALQTSDEHHPVWLCIEVQTDDFLSDLQQRIQAMLDDVDAELLQLKRIRNADRALLSQHQQETLSELTPEEVFEKRLAMEYGSDSDENQDQTQRLRSVFSDVLYEAQHKVDKA